MKNDLINIDFNNCSGEELEIINQKLMSVKMSRYEDKLMQLSDKLEKIEESQGIFEDNFNNELEKRDLKYEKQMNVAVNSIRVNQPKYGYVNQGEFGRYFTISMSSITLGKLLKLSGIAMRSKGRTTPYRNFIPKYAQIQAHENYTSTKWHYERCLDHIDKWLKDECLFEEFYSKETEGEMKIFIDDLYDRYFN